MQQEIINKEIIFEQIDDIIARAISENEAVIISLGIKVGEEENVMETENANGGATNVNIQTQF